MSAGFSHFFPKGAEEMRTPPKGRSEVAHRAEPYDESLLRIAKQSPLKYTAPIFKLGHFMMSRSFCHDTSGRRATLCAGPRPRLSLPRLGTHRSRPAQ